MLIESLRKTDTVVTNVARRSESTTLQDSAQILFRLRSKLRRSQFAGK